jgi:hypothetical protein
MEASMTSRRFVALFTLSLLVLLPFVAVEACGPDFQPDTFVRTARPDNPRTFAQGRLGILQLGFDSNDLAVAYRYLNGGRLSSLLSSLKLHIRPNRPPSP